MFHSIMPLTGSPPISSLTDEEREKVSARTVAAMRELRAICTNLELPIETSLPIAFEVYKTEAGYLAAEVTREARALNSSIVPWRIESKDPLGKLVKVPPKMTAEITTRGNWVAGRIQGIEIDNPERWLVHGMKVGNRYQSLGAGAPYPGVNFRKDGIMSALKLDTLQTAMDFTMFVEYVGPELEGEVFAMTATAMVAEE